jgi:hypothetical protein
MTPFPQMSAAQQLAHWQQTLESVFQTPGAQESVPIETSNKITTTDQSQSNTKRKRPDNYDELTRSQQYIWRKRNENKHNK